MISMVSILHLLYHISTCIAATSLLNHFTNWTESDNVTSPISHMRDHLVSASSQFHLSENDTLLTTFSSAFRRSNVTVTPDFDLLFNRSDENYTTVATPLNNYDATLAALLTTPNPYELNDTTELSGFTGSQAFTTPNDILNNTKDESMPLLVSSSVSTEPPANETVLLTTPSPYDSNQNNHTSVSDNLLPQSTTDIVKSTFERFIRDLTSVLPLNGSTTTMAMNSSLIATNSSEFLPINETDGGGSDLGVGNITDGGGSNKPVNFTKHGFGGNGTINNSTSYVNDTMDFQNDTSVTTTEILSSSNDTFATTVYPLLNNTLENVTSTVPYTDTFRPNTSATSGAIEITTLDHLQVTTADTVLPITTGPTWAVQLIIRVNSTVTLDQTFSSNLEAKLARFHYELLHKKSRRKRAVVYNGTSVHIIDIQRKKDNDSHVVVQYNISDGGLPVVSVGFELDVRSHGLDKMGQFIGYTVLSADVVSSELPVTTASAPIPLTNVSKEYWVVTQIYLEKNESDSPRLRREFEAVLASFFRGHFAARRRRRWAKSGDVVVHVVKVDKLNSPPSDVVYYMSHKGNILAYKDLSALFASSGVTDQHLALALNRRVGKVLAPYVKAPASAAQDDKEMWLWIGIGIGGFFFLLLIIWVLICVIMRVKRTREAAAKLEDTGVEIRPDIKPTATNPAQLANGKEAVIKKEENKNDNAAPKEMSEETEEDDEDDDEISPDDDQPVLKNHSTNHMGNGVAHNESEPPGHSGPAPPYVSPRRGAAAEDPEEKREKISRLLDDIAKVLYPVDARKRRTRVDPGLEMQTLQPPVDVMGNGLTPTPHHQTPEDESALWKVHPNESTDRSYSKHIAIKAHLLRQMANNPSLSWSKPLELSSRNSSHQQVYSMFQSPSSSNPTPSITYSSPQPILIRTKSPAPTSASTPARPPLPRPTKSLFGPKVNPAFSASTPPSIRIRTKEKRTSSVLSPELSSADAAKSMV